MDEVVIQRKRIFSARYLALALLSSIILACQPSLIGDADTETAILRRSLSEDPKTIDPHKAGDVVSSTQCGLVYEQLLEYDYFDMPATLKPCLAESMPEVSEDGLQYSFTLRDDIYFQDDPCFPDGKGREVTSYDVEYSFKRFASLPDTPGYWVFQGQVRGLDSWRTAILASVNGLREETAKADAQQRAFDKPVEGIKVLDRSRFQILLNQPYPQFLYALTMSYAAVIPHEAVNKYGTAFREHPVGTGPFKLDHWEPNKELVWIKNPNFRKLFFPRVPEKMNYGDGLPKREEYLRYEGRELPLADIVQFRIIKESQTSWLEFQAGSLDTSGLDKDTFTSAVRNQTQLTPKMEKLGIQLTYYADPTIHYISFNMKDPIVGTPAGKKGTAIRKAFSLAFDRKDYIDRYTNNRGTLANMLIPPGIFGHEPKYLYKWSRFNPDEGIGILKDAGFIVETTEDGIITLDPSTGKQVSVSIMLRGQGGQTADFARALQFTGRRIGLDVRGEQLTFPEFLRRQEEGLGQAYDAGWVMDYPDPQNMLQLLYGPFSAIGLNSAQYNSQEYDELYERIVAIDHTNPATPSKKVAEKFELIQKMHEVLEMDCPWLLLEFNKVYALSHAWSSPTTPNAFSYNQYKYRHSDPKIRVATMKSWNAVAPLPGLIIGGLIFSILALFLFKVIRQQ